MDQQVLYAIPRNCIHYMNYTDGPEWISVYFTKESDNEYKCNICEAILTTDNKYTELVDHTKDLHKDVYDLHKDNQNSVVGYQVEFLQFSTFQCDESNTEPVILEEICETESEVIKDNALSAKDTASPRKKRSWVWKYFDKLINNISRCKLCNVTLSLKTGNNNNMNRHIRILHPAIYKIEVKHTADEKNETESNSDLCKFAMHTADEKNETESNSDLCKFAMHTADEKNETESNSDLYCHKQKRSWVWAYFKCVSNALAICKLCNKSITYGSTTGNMNRHLKVVHHKTGGEELVHVPTKKDGTPEWISVYFTKQSDNEYKCNICEVILTTDNKYTELVDHTKDLHKDVYDLHKDNPDSAMGYQIKFLQFSMLKYDENNTQPVILEEICETESEVIKDNALPDKDMGMQYILLPNINKSEESSRKRSWVWKYFDKLTNTIFRCNMCNVVLSIKGCNTNNMNRHVRTRHPVVYNCEVELKTHEKNEKESDADLQCSRQRRSWVWAYFDRVSNTLASCKLCNRNICHGGNATGNMNRHLKMIHHKTGDCNYWVWKVFENLEDDFFSCKICQYKCMKIDDVDKCVQTILSHLKTVHGLISGDQIITGAEYEVENE